MKGSGLKLRYRTYFLRVNVPKALQGPLGRREIVRTLSTGDYKEAIVRARAKRTEIDRLFAETRQGGSEAAAGIPEGQLAAIAHEVFAAELRRCEDFVRKRPKASPDDIADALADELDDWILGMREGIWGGGSQERVAAELSKRDVILAPSSPARGEAQRLIARAIIAANVTAQKRAQGDYGYTDSDPIVGAAGRPRAQGITLGQLIERYKKDRGAAWSVKTRTGYTVILRTLEETLGADKAIRTISREDCRRVRDLLTDLPPNYTKLPETRGKSIEEAARVARELDLPRLNPASVNSYLNNLSALFNYATAEDLIDKSPATRLQVVSAVKPKDRWLPFSTAQLQKIFGSDTYSAKAPRNGRFFVPLVALWSGLRLNEICQLLTSDVVQVDRVWCIKVTEGDEGDDKRVKTEAGERLVPVHPELRRIGFLKHCEAARIRGDKRLFPELPKGRDGYFSGPFSKWFSRHLKAIGARKPRTSFHSFRHSFRDALREAGIPAEVAKVLGGWAATETQEEYGAGLKPKTLYDAISKIRYRHLILGGPAVN